MRQGDRTHWGVGPRTDITRPANQPSRGRLQHLRLVRVDQAVSPHVDEELRVQPVQRVYAVHERADRTRIATPGGLWDRHCAGFFCCDETAKKQLSWRPLQSVARRAIFKMSVSDYARLSAAPAYLLGRLSRNPVLQRTRLRRAADFPLDDEERSVDETRFW